MTLWFHQPQAVGACLGAESRRSHCGTRSSPAPRYRSLVWPPGTASRWQNGIGAALVRRRAARGRAERRGRAPARGRGARGSCRRVARCSGTTRARRPSWRSCSRTGLCSSASTSSTGRRPEPRSCASCVTGGRSSSGQACASSASRATRTGRTAHGRTCSTPTSRCSRTGTATLAQRFGAARVWRWMDGVPRRSVFLVGEDGTVLESWRYEDSEVPDFDAPLAAAQALRG